MNPVRLLEHFERIAEAPDAIPRLRRFILDLAVRGKLVEQDLNDEPASELLRRIQSEKVRLLNAGEIRKSKANELKMVEAPYKLPRTWAWAALGSIFLYDAGAKREPNMLNHSLWLLELEDVEKDTGRLVARVRASERSSQSTKSEFQVGDILYGKLRPYLNKVLVADEPGYSTTEIVAIRGFVPICSDYCALALRRPDFVEYVTRLGQGTKMPRLRTEDATVAPFPLPPLAEQHRIVAKVDELMALCDRLEAAQNQREQWRDQLVVASLRQLQDEEGPTPRCQDAEQEKEPDEKDLGALAPWRGSVFLQHIPRLTTRPEHIKALRQIILNLAVRGKLVGQHPEDGPASELLMQVAAEKSRRVQAGKIRPEKPLPPLSEVEKSCELPSGWAWVRLGALVLDSDSGWSPRTENHAREGDAWGVLKVSAVSWDHFDPSANKQLLPGMAPRLQAQVHKGDFLISRANTAELIARAVLVEDEPRNLMMSDKIVRLCLFDRCDHRYVWLVNNHADFARAYYARNATGVSPSMKNVSRNVILDLPLPLPPLAEQHRIVVKVDELMAVCDQLEANLTATQTDSRRLLEAVLHEALVPARRDAA